MLETLRKNGVGHLNKSIISIYFKEIKNISGEVDECRVNFDTKFVGIG